MSVQLNHYCIVGHKFDYDEFYDKVSQVKGFDDTEEAVEHCCDYEDSAYGGIEHKNDLCVMSDGMCGNYVFVGWVIQKSGDYGTLEDFVNDKPTPTPETVDEWIMQEFGVESKCKVQAFTHHT